MSKLRPEVILLKGAPNFVEGQLSSAAYPGQHIVFGGANEFDLGGVADAGVLRIVTENDLIGKTIEDVYAVDENVIAHVPAKGDRVMLRIPAAAAAIAKGGLIKRGALGDFVGGGIAADAVAEASEAVDNSGGASATFIQATII